uniref:Uncharacterized protein n=1 Tax=Aegilops tauschii subsp. strangulata TaxID=200361 RepID=A0A452YCI4_AEGTS
TAHLASLGARIVVGYIGDSAPAEQLVASLNAAAGSSGPRAVAVCADVSDPVQVERLFDAAQAAFGRDLHIVVTAAGFQDAAYPAIRCSMTHRPRLTPAASRRERQQDGPGWRPSSQSCCTEDRLAGGAHQLRHGAWRRRRPVQQCRPSRAPAGRLDARGRCLHPPARWVELQERASAGSTSTSPHRAAWRRNCANLLLDARGQRVHTCPSVRR